MQSKLVPFIAVSVLWLSIAASSAAAGLTAVDLRCDLMTDPLGVDSNPPRLSWRLQGDGARGQRQTAWQIIVASSQARLAEGHGAVWDSGRVVSSEQLHVPYAGRALRSGERVFWQVRVWDAEGRASPWSAPATWTMGLLENRDWSAKWITDPGLLQLQRPHLGYSSQTTQEANTTKWVQLDLGAPQAIEAVRLYALTHTVPERLGFPIRFKVEAANDPAFHEARLIADYTQNDFPNVWVNRIDLPAGGITARYIRLTAPTLRVTDGDARLAFSQIAVLAAGKNVAVGATVTASDSLESSLWSAAAVVDGIGIPESNPRANATLLLRHEFAARPTLRRALLNICGLGHYDLAINGRTVSANILKPGWTSYAKTDLYDTYDVTDLIRAGSNAIGVTLAGGMYNVQPGQHRYTKFVSAFRPLTAIAQLRLEYADGTVETIGSDANWRAAPGPITYANVFGGEDFDARRVPAGWDAPGFDDSGWTPAVTTAGPGGVLRGASHAGPPITEHETLKPVNVRDLQTGVRVYDLGQNAALMPRLHVHGTAGGAVKITPAELLKADGSVDRVSCGRGDASWQYTLAGKQEGETWFPKFFYHGARYLQVELTAASDQTLPQIDGLEGVVVHSASPATGEFACSSELFNRIHSLIRWAQRSNLAHVLTDCPHRERLGWLEQYHLNGPSLRYEFDLGQLYGKTFGDMVDSQEASGLVPSIAPDYVIFSEGFRDSPEWGSALILSAWQQYVWTGDDTPLRRYYAAMQRYVDYLTSRSSGGIVSHGLGDWYDIGPNPPGTAQLTPVPLTATAFYYLSTRTFADISDHLGRADTARRYRAQAEAIKGAFNHAFFDAAQSTYATGSQTALALPLVLDLVPAGQREAVLDLLVRDVRQRGNAVTAGDIGYRYLLRALGDGGRSDVIYEMNSQSEKPGYGYQLAHGATSLTEAWDASPHHSQNHFMLGQLMEWFYADLVGLASDPAAAGFSRVIIKPKPVAGIEWARARYESPRGPVAVAWRRESGSFILEVSLPPNCTATVHLPAAPEAAITESGTPLAAALGVKQLKRESTRAVIEVNSGHFEFRTPMPTAPAP
jgi:hypothetical protein